MTASLQWGPSDDFLMKKVKDIRKCGGGIAHGPCVLKNFPGDCGALLLTGANLATKKSLKALLQVASLAGFSKIFATVVAEPDFANTAVTAFKATRWKCVSKSKSNRNEYKDDYVFVKIIRNCKYKGY